MTFPTDLQIAQAASLKPLGEIADAMGIPRSLLEPYGDDVAIDQVGRDRGAE